MEKKISIPDILAAVFGSLTDDEYRVVKAALEYASRAQGPFICGHIGEKDGMGLPSAVMVCPQYGLDGFAVYTKTHDYDAPGW